MGVMYEHGTGVEKNSTKARELYEEARRAGLAHAPCNLGVMYQHRRAMDKERPHTGATSLSATSNSGSSLDLWRTKRERRKKLKTTLAEQNETLAKVSETLGKTKHNPRA